MAPLILDEETLGQKHQNFNKQVQDAMAQNKEHTLTKIDYDDSDIDNLMKIDIANRKRNVDYILEVLKCEDMLYVSRALKRCSWLVIEQQYAHVINPEYFNTHLFPYMITTAINKLLLFVRLNLKEEKRVEEFYDYIKRHRPDEAFKWLQHCSLNFIESVLQNESHVPLYLYKRLCRKSFRFVKYYTNVAYSGTAVLQTISFLFVNHTEEFLDFLDTIEGSPIPNISKKHTEIIMKKCPHRIFDNYKKFASRADVSTVAKHLKVTEVMSFLLNHMKNVNLKHFLSRYENLKHFVMCMPEEDRHEFIKYFIIERNEAPTCKTKLTTYCALAADYNAIYDSKNLYRWYQHMPFNVAFSDMKKLIRNESSPSERSEMFTVLVNASHGNPHHLHTVLQHYRENHINEPFNFKLQFLNSVLTQNAMRFDDSTWTIVDQLFCSMEVYAESDKNVQTCIRAIILYKTINDHEIPQIIEQKFTFDTFKQFQSQLNLEQKDKIYTYLFHYISVKINNENIDNELQFEKVVGLLKNAFNLLQDWNKDIIDYPILLTKIQQMISLKKEKSWTTELSSLYDMNKKWRRHMFAESLSLRASKEVCLNALKHEPRLLSRHGDEVATMRVEDALFLFAKLRVYWPHIAHQWSDEYYYILDGSSGHKAAIVGLFSLLPRKRAIDIVKQYVPDETKINWDENDQREFSIRKYIAMYMHLTRPLPPLDAVLWYAKGDYLQYAVPSLSAVLHNLSKTHSREHILKLVEAPVSLQKHGIAHVYNKFESEDIVPMFSNIWKYTKNSTIRALLISYTHKMLCTVNESAHAKDIWALFNTFIDNLSYDENKIIYQKLGQVKNIHSSVRGDFFVKSYKLLKSLPPKNDCQCIVDDLTTYAPIIMHLLDPEFVADDLLASIEERFITTNCSNINDVISSFILNGNTEEEQLRRFDRILIPILDRAFRYWNTVVDNKYLVKNNFNNLTGSIVWNFKTLLINRKIQVPAKLFSAIKKNILNNFPTREKYLLSTYWKLMEAYAKLVEEHKSIIDNVEPIQIPDIYYQHRWMRTDKIEKIWYEINNKISTSLGMMFAKYLKEDVKLYFPSMYSLFGKVLCVFFDTLSSSNIFIMNVLKNMLDTDFFIPSYILVCETLSRYGIDKREEALCKEIRDKLLLHPSEEVQMHFIEAFRHEPKMNNDKEQDEK